MAPAVHRRMPQSPRPRTALVALFRPETAFRTKLAVSMAAFAAHESAASIASGAAWGQTVAIQIRVEGSRRLFDVLPPFFGNPIVGVGRPLLLCCRSRPCNSGAHLGHRASVRVSAPTPPALTSPQYFRRTSTRRRPSVEQPSSHPDQTVLPTVLEYEHGTCDLEQRRRDADRGRGRQGRQVGQVGRRPRR